MCKIETKQCTSPRRSGRFRARSNSLLLRFRRTKAKSQRESATGGRGKAPCTLVSGGEFSAESSTLPLSRTLSQIRGEAEFPSRVLYFEDDRRDSRWWLNQPDSTDLYLCE